MNMCLSPFALNEKTVHLKCEERYRNDCDEDQSLLALRTSVKIFLTTNNVDVLEDSLKNRKHDITPTAAVNAVCNID